MAKGVTLGVVESVAVARELALIEIFIIGLIRGFKVYTDLLAGLAYR